MRIIITVDKENNLQVLDLVSSKRLFQGSI